VTERIPKKDRGRVFRDLHDEIFNSKLTTQRLLVPLRLYEEIQAVKRDLKKKIKGSEHVDPSQLFLIDGGYHVLFAVHELCDARDIDPFDFAEATKLIKSAIALVKDLVATEKAKNEAFTTNRYFKDPKTKTQIQRAVVTNANAKKSKKVAAAPPSNARRRKERK
jgi:hypothetical protein